jgi:hypothetical protein
MQTNLSLAQLHPPGVEWQIDLSSVSNGIYLLIIFDNDKNISNSRISILK